MAALSECVAEELEEKLDVATELEWVDEDWLCRDVLVAPTAVRPSVDELNRVVEELSGLLDDNRGSDPALEPESSPKPLKTVNALEPPHFTSP